MTDQQPVDYHYRVIARAIAEIDGPGGAQLSLDDLSARLGMSPAHFQRTFSTWVGVSPKRFQQYLTLDHARRLLADRRNMLETAHEAGLSGASRLHDLFLRWEAMSPGQFATGAAGVEMAWGRFPSPFGEVLAMGTDRGLCGLAFTDGTGFEAAFADLSGRWPAATFREAPARLEPWLTAAFTQQGEARLTLIGAPFQIKVWEALLTIPSGQVTTYTDVARAVGHPKAVRAIGTAVGRNPISFLIPCHRALRTTGALGGYHWGLPVKRAILAWEGARADDLAA
jgi:AraC family transcriptional regulator of adaptative response/methylated-DNA-[protein]-cysteine methyltransferase